MEPETRHTGAAGGEGSKSCLALSLGRPGGSPAGPGTQRITWETLFFAGVASIPNLWGSHMNLKKDASRLWWDLRDLMLDSVDPIFSPLLTLAEPCRTCDQQEPVDILVDAVNSCLLGSGVTAVPTCPCQFRGFRHVGNRPWPSL